MTFKIPTALELANSFARSRMKLGMNFDDTNAATARYLFGNTECSAMYAQTLALRATAQAEAEINGQYLDISLSTSETIVLANPVNGERTKVCTKVVIHALQCLARSQANQAAATV